MVFSNLVMSDINELASVHLKCWNETYRGIIPDDYLDQMSIESRVKIWTKVLGSHGHYCETIRVEGRLVAFLSAGRALEKEGYPDQEIFALYILKAFQRKNLGRELCTRLFTTKNCQSVCAWVLRENPSCQFYERIGGIIIDSRQTEMSGKKFEEVLYRIEKA
ncbi:MAG: GNAT family N-acetyltransferase [Proteobacteria bacterium]|nr:MAG: GNAT family N-acetyltransferase [Pseudomonadota bacterium]